jgi:hypothetical protein
MKGIQISNAGDLPNHEDFIPKGKDSIAGVKRGADEEEEEAFHLAHDAGKKRRVDAQKTEKVSLLDPFTKELGHSCGYCLLVNPDAQAEVHNLNNCPNLPRELRGAAYDISTSIRERHPYNCQVVKTCYRCHIPSKGGNKLHDDYVRGQTTCRNSNLILPLAAHLFMYEEHRYHFTQATGIDIPSHVFQDSDSWAEWFTSPLEKPHGCKGYAILTWFFDYFNLHQK